MAKKKVQVEVEVTELSEAQKAARRRGGLNSAEARGRAPDRTDEEREARARRARERRARKKLRKAQEAAEVALAELYEHKPIEQWDLEELAFGRPRNMQGGFSGPRPKWITAEHHDKIVKQFQKELKVQAGRMMPDVLRMLSTALTDEETWVNADGVETGFKWPPSVKVKVAQLLLEYLLGKPTQHQQVEMSGQLQHLLGSAIVNPDHSPAQGFIEAESWEDGDDDESDLAE